MLAREHIPSEDELTPPPAPAHVDAQWQRREDIRLTHVVKGLRASFQHSTTSPEQKVAAWIRLQYLEEWPFLFDAHKHCNEGWTFLVMNRLSPIVSKLFETVDDPTVSAQEKLWAINRYEIMAAA